MISSNETDLPLPPPDFGRPYACPDMPCAVWTAL